MTALERPAPTFEDVWRLFQETDRLLDEHLDRLALFKDCWPEYAGYRLLGGVAGVVVPEDVARYAYRQGLYVLAQSGDAVEIRNDGRFAAREW